MSWDWRDRLRAGPTYVEKVAPGYSVVYEVESYLKEIVTQLQRVDIVTHGLFGKMMFIDGRVQVTEGDEWVYHEVLTHPALLAHEKPRRVAILGGGDGGALREVLKHACVEDVHLVDIDPHVIETSKSFLPEISKEAFNDPRVTLHFMDGREFIEREGGFDVIIVDVTDPATSGPAKLYTREFYGAAFSALNNGGIVVTQAEDLHFSPTMMLVNFYTIYRTVASVFPSVYASRAFMPSWAVEWGFVAGSKGVDISSVATDVLRRRAEERGVRTRFYSPELHASLFTMPANVREALSRTKLVVTDAIVEREKIYGDALYLSVEELAGIVAVIWGRGARQASSG